MSDGGWRSAVRTALRTFLLWVAGVAGTILLGSFNLLVAAILAPVSLVIIAGMDAHAWRQRRSRHRGEQPVTSTPELPALPAARRKVLGRGMSQVHISGLPPLTVDVIDLLERLADEAAKFGRYLTLTEASQLKLVGPYGQARDVVQVALNNGLVELVYIEMAGQSFLKLTERGRTILDAEPMSLAADSAVLNLPITASGGQVIIVSPAIGERVLQRCRIVGYANTFEGTVIIEAVENGIPEVIGIATAAMTNDISDINRFSVEVELPRSGAQTIRLGAYSPKGDGSWEGVYLEIYALPAPEIASSAGVKEETAVKSFGVQTTNGAELEQIAIPSDVFERFRREWANKETRDKAKQTARSYIASNPNMVLELGGKSYDELVNLMNEHRAAGLSDEATRVDIWIVGSLPPQEIAGTADISLFGPSAHGEGDSVN